MNIQTSKQIVLATGNQGKVAEMQSSLQEFGFEVLPQSQFEIPEAIEDGLTFVENAIIKARHACALTGLPSIADDSGLEVDALLGAPGIYSSRYANEVPIEERGNSANNAKLLKEMTGQENRAARFQCVIVFMRHEADPTPIICQGTWNGLIAESLSGANGFGYDPLFYIAELKCSSAELAPEEKKPLSHRGQALAQLKAALQLQPWEHIRVIN